MAKKIVWAIVATLIAAALTIGIGIGIGAAESDSQMKYNSLNYDVTVADNGDLRIVQDIDVRLDKRGSGDDAKPWRQLYQQYTLNTNNLLDITDISVENLTTGETYTQSEPVNAGNVYGGKWDTSYAKHWYIGDITNGDTLPTAYRPFDNADATYKADEPRKRKVELGWNIPKTMSAKSMKFRVSMTWRGTGTTYEDVTTFKWEPFGENNQMPMNNVSVNVHMPNVCTQDTGKENGGKAYGSSAERTGTNPLCRTWVHYSKQSTVTRSEDGTLTVSMNQVPTGTYLDVVAMFPSVAGHAAVRGEDRDAAASLIDSEGDEERTWYKHQRTKAIVTIVAWLVVFVGGLALTIPCVIKALRVRKYAEYLGGIEYWREPLHMTPAVAAQINQVLKSTSPGGVDKEMMGATMLSLISRKFIAVYPGPASMYAGIDMSRVHPAGLAQFAEQRLAMDPSMAKANTNTIVLLPPAYDMQALLTLSPSERTLLDMLQEASRLIGNLPVFDMNAMKHQFKKHAKKGAAAIAAFEDACRKELDASKALATVRGGVYAMGVIGMILGIISMMAFTLIDGMLALAFIIGIPVTFLGFLGVMLMPARVFTGQPDDWATAGGSGAAGVAGVAGSAGGADAAGALPKYVPDGPGQQMAGHVQGLRRYLLDFSDFSDRGVLDLMLWDQYLVFATAFGIADKAMAQLRQAYPQLSDQRWLDEHGYHSSNIYWSNRTYVAGSVFASMNISSGMSGFSDLGSALSSSMNSISNTISAANSSSSSGGGGSFGGSGGGSGGGSFGGR
ncbi:DUF2207 domain-containing protein [Bifidobacterium gallicum]|uniref:DUF2207 domain-containing protein n=1 Tax=Bifidobacterium gallicum TaxID=78342 RepID=UPI0005C77B05|nr:DUF2207 domain-containing protein [Bifidobacterium gallicum]